GLQREGFRHVFILSSPEEVAAVMVERQPLWSNRKDDHGPFDIIGDVHGCCDELEDLLARLDYVASSTVAGLGGRTPVYTHAEGRKAVFLEGLVSHYVLDDGQLVVAHAGLKEAMQGRGSREVRAFTLYGETTGETDEFGLPVRYNWAAEYHGKAAVVYGHTPVPRPEWLNNTINIDTGCVFGARLTALRYPERELVSVPARRTYQEPLRSFPVHAGDSPDLTAQQHHDEVLDIDDVLGKRIVETRLQGNITIREENASAALEVMSRFAADPKWLIYLPPTMSPSETSKQRDLLEHPEEAFAYYRKEGTTHVI